MEHSDLNKFANCMKALQEVFSPREPVSDTKMKLYYNLFKAYPIADIERACLEICACRKITTTFPVPAEILEKITGSVDELAVRAFDEFKKAMNRIGPYNSVSFADRTIHEVILSFGGWVEICEIPDSEWRFRRKEWMELYKVLKKQPRDTPERLAGLIEAANSQNEGWKKYIPDTILIGVQEERKMIE